MVARTLAGAAALLAAAATMAYVALRQDRAAYTIEVEIDPPSVAWAQAALPKVPTRQHQQSQMEGPTVATYSDDFNRSNATDLGASWTDVSGTANTFQINSNRAYLNFPGPAFARYESDLDSADHYVQARYHGGGSTPGWAIVARCNVPGTDNMSNRTQYEFGYYPSGMEPWTLARVVSGTRTVIATSDDTGPSAGDMLRMEVNGSSIKCYHGETLIFDETDANITDGVRCGIASFGGFIGNAWDDWSCGDLDTGGGDPEPGPWPEGSPQVRHAGTVGVLIGC